MLVRISWRPKWRRNSTPQKLSFQPPSCEWCSNWYLTEIRQVQCSESESAWVLTLKLTCSLLAGASADAPKPASPATDDLLKSTATVRKEAKSVHAPQWFAQVAQSPKTKASLADKATPAHPVLASFQVEQAGPELRIVDGDGSVYSGYLQIAAAARPQRSAKTEAARASHVVKTGWPAVF